MSVSVGVLRAPVFSLSGMGFGPVQNPENCRQGYHLCHHFRFDRLRYWARPVQMNP